MLASATSSELARSLSDVQVALAHVADSLAKMERRLAQEKARLEILNKVSAGQEQHLAGLRRGDAVVSLPEFGKMRMSMHQHRQTCKKLRANISVLESKVKAEKKNQQALKEQQEALLAAQANRGKVIQFRGRSDG